MEEGREKRGGQEGERIGEKVKITPRSEDLCGSASWPMSSSPKVNAGDIPNASNTGCGHGPLKSTGHIGLLEEVAPQNQCFSPPIPFPPEPPKFLQGGLQNGDTPNNSFSIDTDGTGHVSSGDRETLSVKRKKGISVTSLA